MTNGASGDDRLSKNQRRETAREKARLLREQQKKKDRRSRVALQGTLIIASLAIVATVTLVIVNSVRPPNPGPLNMQSDGITIGTGFEAVTTPALAAGEDPVPATADAVPGAIPIQIWLDYQCPDCNDFEKANAEQISTLVTQGVVTFEIHPVAILDRASLGDRYSSRAANATACVANYSPNSFFDFSAALFANQPDMGTSGLTDDDLLALATGAGVEREDRVSECISSETFATWVADATERAAGNPDLLGAEGRFGTPTVLVNGKKYTGAPGDATAFAQFIASADSERFSEENVSPSPSPVP